MTHANGQANMIRAALRSAAYVRLPFSTRRCAGRADASSSAAPQLDRLSLVVTSPTSTQLLAGYFASELRTADCYLLYGSVGSGKSFFW